MGPIISPASGDRYILAVPTLRALFLVAAIALIAACAQSGDATGRSAPPGPAPEGMVWIPGGTFAMGDDGPFALPHERPVHRVTVSGFYMDVDAVTNAEFAAFVKATGHVTVAERTPVLAEIMSGLPAGTPPPPPDFLVPGSLVFTPAEGEVDLRDVSRWWRWVPGASWRHPQGPGSDLTGRERHPVVQVAWEDAVAYAAWVGGRLPTEAEWEYAARGGHERAAHPWGDAPHDSAHPQAHIYTGTFPAHPAQPIAVGTLPPNGYGLHDMAGNVWQWTADWYHPDTYARRAGIETDPTGPAGGLDPRTEGEPTRVIRGGSFLCSDVYCRGYRVSARGTGAPDTGASHIGFRVVVRGAPAAR
ncbi:MAG: formylglycine-generating enzyme family protein [Gemmatimonadetes bacterium]|nr:formylglycine-generating enzyme family protein [Gemmatimonadota bacterium]MCC6771206.1 formylglycine-generating enzyme family protein [Gemmatimonadaceae bacterium]